MLFSFAERQVLHAGNPDPAVGAPKFEDSTQPLGWNHGVAAYKAAFGEAA
ncbi:MAG: hypothetical protein JKY65_12940 [Planctomycetes bacterium]|nr:hypothetical protein [Planctomycetota bacterium]